MTTVCSYLLRHCSKIQSEVNSIFPASHQRHGAHNSALEQQSTADILCENIPGAVKGAKVSLVSGLLILVLIEWQYLVEKLR